MGPVVLHPNGSLESKTPLAPFTCHELEYSPAARIPDLLYGSPHLHLIHSVLIPQRCASLGTEDDYYTGVRLCRLHVLCRHPFSKLHRYTLSSHTPYWNTIFRLFYWENCFQKTGRCIVYCCRVQYRVYWGHTWPDSNIQCTFRTSSQWKWTAQ